MIYLFIIFSIHHKNFLYNNEKQNYITEYNAIQLNYKIL